MPLFALANTGVVFNPGWTGALLSTSSLGVSAGLLLGKPLGIMFASSLATKVGISKLPGDLSSIHILRAGFLGGIGFAMLIFITLLAFEDPLLVQSTKISILLSSLLAGVTGYLILIRSKSNDAAQTA